MAWVRFTADYDWSPRYGVTIAYKEGMTLNVPSACATLAIAAGKAVRLRKAHKDVEPVAESADEAPPTDVGVADGDA